MLLYSPYCCKNNAINQPGNKADYHQDLICSGPRLCDCDIYKVNCQRAKQDNFYYVKPFHGSDCLDLLPVNQEEYNANYDEHCASEGNVPVESMFLLRVSDQGKKQH